MAAGRTPVLAITKRLQGTDRKDRQKEVIQFNIISEVPKPEVWLDSRAKKYFKNICKLLIDKGLLTDGNIGHAVIMSQELSTYEEACRAIKDDGMIQTIDTKNGSYEQVSPWVGIRNQAQKNYRDYAALFGLDPVSAMKVSGPAKSDKDPFEEMQNKYNQET
jgi:P27 family predicted phage terminase small subunit